MSIAHLLKKIKSGKSSDPTIKQQKMVSKAPERHCQKGLKFLLA
jgi:hypothetical protein